MVLREAYLGCGKDDNQMENHTLKKVHLLNAAVSKQALLFRVCCL